MKNGRWLALISLLIGFSPSSLAQLEKHYSESVYTTVGSNILHAPKVNGLPDHFFAIDFFSVEILLDDTLR